MNLNAVQTSKNLKASRVPGSPWILDALCSVEMGTSSQRAPGPHPIPTILTLTWRANNKHADEVTGMSRFRSFRSKTEIHFIQVTVMASIAARTLKLSLAYIAILLFATSGGLQAQQPSAHLSDSLRMLPLPGYDVTYPFDDEPYGVAVDQGGNLYVTDEENGTITEVQRVGNSYSAITVLQDLTSPFGIAVDGQGNLYITQAGESNNVIKETASSTPYSTTYTRSLIPVEGLGQPAGIAVDPKGNVYIADVGNHRILKEAPSGNGYAQSTIPSSPLSMPYGVAVDGNGDVFIADFGHNRVLKEAPSSGGYTESTVSNHIANNPLGVAVDACGDVYVLSFVDQETASVWKETPSQGAYTQTAVPIAPNLDPTSIAVDASGLYLASPGENQLAKLVMGAGDFGSVNVTETSLPIALVFTFDEGGSIATPSVLTQGINGLDFADAGTGTCGNQGSYNAGDTCDVNVLFSPLAPGDRYGVVALRSTTGDPAALGYVYGVGDAPLVGFPPGSQAVLDSPLAHPRGVAVDVAGNIYVTESRTGKLYKETSSSGGSSRTIIAQGLEDPTGVAIDGAGNLYIAAAGGVYRETPAPGGGYSQSEITVGPVDLAGIAVDGNANLYLISSTSGDVHKETRAPDATYHETAIGAGIANPTGVAIDGSGDIFATDARQGKVYKETLNQDGSYAQSVIAAGLDAPAGIAADGSTTVYVAASGSDAVFEYSQQANGTYTQMRHFVAPSMAWGVALDSRKNLYVTQNVGDGLLSKIDLADPPAVSFATTRAGEVSAPQTVMVANSGNVGLGIFPLAAGSNPGLSPGFRLAGETSCPLAESPGNDGIGLSPADSCIYAIEFAPTAHKNYEGTLTIRDDSLNRAGPGAQQTVMLSGLGVTSDTTRTTMRISPNPVKAGLGVTMTITVLDTTAPASVPAGGVTVADTVGNTSTTLNGGAPMALTSGKAVLTMIPTVAGTHTITAHYDGVDASVAGSTYEADLTVQP